MDTTVEEQPDRVPESPFLREIDAASRFNPQDVLRGVLVELVLTDDVVIYDRRTVAAADVDRALEDLNSRARASVDVHVRWRRALSYSEPVNMVCRLCGRKHCLCR